MVLGRDRVKWEGNTYMECRAVRIQTLKVSTYNHEK